MNIPDLIKNPIWMWPAFIIPHVIIFLCQFLVWVGEDIIRGFVRCFTSFLNGSGIVVIELVILSLALGLWYWAWRKKTDVHWIGILLLLVFNLLYIPMIRGMAAPVMAEDSPLRIQFIVIKFGIVYGFLYFFFNHSLSEPDKASEEKD